MQFEKIITAEDQSALIKVKDALKVKGFVVNKENIDSFRAERGSGFSNIFSFNILKYKTILNVRFDEAGKKIIFSYDVNTAGCISSPEDQQKFEQELRSILSDVSGVGKEFLDSNSINGNTSLSAEPALADLYNPRGSFQWLAVIVMIIGILTGGAIGAGVGAVVAIKIYKLDKSKKSNGKKIFLSGLYILLGTIAYFSLAILIMLFIN
ncbi:MAG: hypothetical protein WA063_07040 [Minisyncoccia bacterium]